MTAADMNDSDFVTLAIAAGVAEITLAVPGKGNNLNARSAGALLRCVDAACRSREVRCIMLAGSNGFFCAGGDILAMVEGVATLPATVHEIVSLAHAAILRLAEATIPVLVAIDGVAAGGGLGLALSGDIVIASERARFRAAHTAVGFPGDCGLSWFLPRAIGRQRAADLILSNRILNAAEALEWGLVSRLFATDTFMDEARDLARSLAEGAGGALCAAKELQRLSGELSLKRQMEAELNAMVLASSGTEAKRALTAFYNGRATKSE